MENLSTGLYLGTVQNNVFRNSNSVRENESKEQSRGFDLLLVPSEIILHIFSFLTLKDLVHVGATCRTWKLCSEDVSIWAIFCNRINHRPKSNEQLKLVVVEKIKSLIADTKKTNPEKALQAHLTLSDLGLSSLEKAFSCAKTITITEEEKKTDPSSPFYSSSFYDKCYSLAYAYLANNNLTKAEEIMTNMVPSTIRGVIAFEIVKIYLKIGNLEKALCAMNCIKPNQNESFPSLSLFIWQAKQTNNIDIALRALKEFSSFAICLSCVKDFNEFLIESGECEKSTYLQTLYPQLFEENTLSNDVMYYTYNGQIEEAIQRALSFPEIYSRIAALDKIGHAIKNSNYVMINLKERQKKLNEIDTLKQNLWKDLTSFIRKPRMET